LRRIGRRRYRLRVQIRCDDARSLTAQAVAFHNGMLNRGTELDRLRVVARLHRKSRARDVTSLAENDGAETRIEGTVADSVAETRRIR